MKRMLVLIGVLVTAVVAQGQYTLRLIVEKTATKPLDDIYVAGSFNNWNPRDPQYKLKPYGTSRKAIVINNLKPGKYQYKFTRGSWQSVETTAKGAAIDNREQEVNEDVSTTITIAGWQDDFPDKPKPFTASAQVKLMDTAFFMPQLNRTRRIWIYLPKDYATSKKQYPVLYMQDGQNLFNEQTAAFGEWGIDETLDSIQAKTGKACIVVGIDHGGNTRMSEYNPYDNTKYGKGEGKAYTAFLVETLKPFIDKKYRTITGPSGTFIGGSSMGGLISTYAVTHYPQVFGGAGIFSPSYWIAPDIFEEAKNAAFSGQYHSIYFYAGENEGQTMVPDMKTMIAIVESKKTYHLMQIVNPLGKHDEKTWRKEFPFFYKFILQ